MKTSNNIYHGNHRNSNHINISFSILIIIKGLRIVKQSEAMIVERLGKYNKTLEAGINVIIPIVTSKEVQWNMLLKT